MSGTASMTTGVVLCPHVNSGVGTDGVREGAGTGEKMGGFWWISGSDLAEKAPGSFPGDGGRGFPEQAR